MADKASEVGKPTEHQVLESLDPAKTPSNFAEARRANYMNEGLLDQRKRDQLRNARRAEELAEETRQMVKRDKSESSSGK